MLNEHGMKSAILEVTPALARSDEDEDEGEAITEEHRIMRRTGGKSQFLDRDKPDMAFATNRLARSLAKPSKIRHHCVELLRDLCGAQSTTQSAQR